MSVEDALIAKLQLHRDIKELVMAELRQAGIECQETAFTDPRGDIVLIHTEDAAQAKTIIQAIQQRANP